MERNKYLLCFAWIILLQCHLTDQEPRTKRQATNAQPRIVSNDGHLVFQTGQNHNITFRSSQGGFVNVDGENINHIVQLVKNNNAQLQQLQGQQASDSFVARLAALESSTTTQIQQLTDRIQELESGSTPVPPTQRPAASQAALRRLTRRVSTLESRLRTIQRNLQRDNCRSSPCQNGGTCEDGYNAYVCRCPPAWGGARCDVDTNECSDYAGTDLGCQNGATCVNLQGGYRCECTAQWHGLRCTETHDDCTGASSEALCGHGTCVNQARTATGEARYHCICDEGWTKSDSSPACSVDVDECDSRTPRCSVNPAVVCINLPGSYHCGPCPNGYSGNGHVCVDVDECVTNNGGCSLAPRVQCINTLGSNTCGSCPPGYSGDGRTCLYQLTCGNNNGGCHPLATCREGVGFSMRSCTCPAGYVGSGVGAGGCTQQQGGGGGGSAGPCANVNCGNGRCTSTYLGHVCVCNPGWHGASCSQNIDECVSFPCMNGGTCTDGIASYTCSCTQGFTGLNCQTPRQGCTDRLTQPSGMITYPPVIGQKYPHGASCEWTIITNPSKVLSLTFTRFKLESHAACSYDYVEIMDGSASPVSLGRFCGQDIPPTVNSTHNQVVVRFQSDASESHDGFELHWTSVAPVCGGVLRGQSHGVVSSPGYPGNYPHNRDCVWVVRANPGKKILFTLGHIAIETHSNCTNDYLQIRDGMSERSTALARYCSTQDPAPVTTSGPYAHIRFHSDESSSDRGFQLSYIEQPAAPGCGGNFSTTSGILISPNYPNPYPHRAECIWVLNVPEGEHITLTFTNIDLEDHHNCLRDYVEVRDGDDEEANFVGRYCDAELPPPYRSSGNTLWVRLRTDSSVTGSGFRATWDVVCGGTFTAPTGELTSPYFPNPYPSDKECIYLISQPAGNIITLTFLTFDIEASRGGTCRYDYLEARDGETANSTLIQRLCGPSVPDHISSTSNFLWLKFRSDGSIQNHGFRATYAISEGGGATGGGEDGAEPVGPPCGGALTGTSGSLTSPGFPSTYPHGVNCTWWLTVPPGFIIRLTFTLFQLESHQQCRYDYVQVFDNSTEAGSLGRYCGETPPPIISSTDNVLVVTFRSDSSVAHEGFAASYVALNATTACGREVRDSMGLISSPMYPANYPPNRDCEWTIVVDMGQQILLNITDFEVATSSGNNCSQDYLEVRNGGMSTSPLVGTYCGTSYDPVIRSHSNRLYIKFHSDANLARRGFQAMYDGTLSGCGGLLTGQTGSFVSPNFPLAYGHNAECYWSLSVSHGSRVNLHFLAFSLESHSQCQFDYVELRDTAGGRELGRYCGDTVPQPVLSHGNTMYVKFRTDYSSARSGFHATYHSSCDNHLSSHSGVIESPNFPDPFLNAQMCSWVIEAPQGNSINVSFSHFNIEDQGTCTNNYLEVRDGQLPSSPLIGKYCGVDILPPNIASTQEYLFVHFVSADIVSHNRFRLDYIVNGCGGEFRAMTGSFTSPNYPDVYPGDRQCLYSIVTAPGTAIELTLHDFDMESHQNCQYDALEIYGGMDLTSPLLAKLCHSQSSPQLLTSTGNHMLLRFRSDQNTAGRGFSASYRTVEGGCGGNFSTPTGSIMSKNYPGNYPHNTDCTWLISIDSNQPIVLTFEDLSIEAHAACRYDYVAVYDGADYNATELIKLCGTTLQNNTFVQSTGSQMFIRMRTDSSYSSRGFKASYTTGCGGHVIANQDGEITSPGWPGKYSNNLNCTWVIQAPEMGDKITLTMTHLDVEANNNCTLDYLRVLAGDDEYAPALGRYCGSTAPPAITSPGAALSIQFHTDESSVASGFRAVYTTSTSACGGDFTSEHGAFNSPGYPDTYPHNVECVWNIVTSPGNRIMLTFSEFSLEMEDEEECSNDYIEVREGGAGGTLSGRYCGLSLPTNVTVGSNLWVKFRSNAETPGQGFRAQYNSMYGGELYGSSGQLASPRYPMDYPRHVRYVWLISVPVGQRVAVRFITMQMEPGPNCGYDYVEIRNGGASADVIDRYCGTVVPPSFISNGNQIHVTFQSDYAIQGPGFLLEWQATSEAGFIPTTPAPSFSTPPTGPLSCDQEVLLGAEPVTLSSPGYPNGYASGLRCVYRIRAPMGQRVWLNFTDVDLESHNYCLYDKVSVTSGGRRLVRACDERHEGSPWVSSGNSMDMVFQTDGSVNRTGFSAQLKAVCGGVISGSVGSIQSPGFPGDYPADENCTWTIVVQPGRTVAVSFTTFDINSAGSCSDSLTIFNGMSTSSPVLGGGGGALCGSSVPSVPESSSNALTVRFISDSGGSGRGFNLTFQQRAVACGGQLELTASVRSGILTSPRYPDPYPQNVECIWVITAPPNERIGADFIGDFQLESHTDCEYDYVEVRDGGSSTSPLLGRVCGSSRPDSLRSLGNTLYIRFRTDASAQHTGFQLRYSAGHCGGSYSGQSGVLESPNYPNDYGPNVHCEWLLTAPTGHFITFTFATFHLEGGSDCAAGDYVSIREHNSTGFSLGQYCGSNIPSAVDTSDSTAFVTFHSNGQNNFPGFRITWAASVEECGGELTVPTAVITSPNYPGLYAHRRRCVWHIRVAEGRRVTLTFSAFDLELHPRCMADYVLVYNGVTRESPIMAPGPLCGSDIPAPLESSSNTMTVVFSTDGSGTGEGFMLTYTSDMPAVCGGPLPGTGDGGTVISPGFHDNEGYNHSTQCVWTISNSRRANSSVQILFETFALESHGECAYDFVEIREGSGEDGELVGRFCDNSTLPPPIASPEASLTIRFVSDYAVSDRGFKLNYFFTSCGGILTDPTGVLTSPNYPDSYNHGDSCAWKIIAPEGTQIRIQFTDMHIEEHEDCEYDYLEIFNGGLASSPSVGKYCGENTPEAFLSMSNQLRIEFHTDSSSSDRGFRATYSFVTAGCGGLYHGLQGALTSPDWPSGYPVSTECVWDIVAEPGYHLIFQFTPPFDIQRQDVCEQDYVEITDMSNEPGTSLGRYCGTEMPADVQTSSYRAQVKFRSDDNINGNGFGLNYTAGCGGVFTATEGTFTSPGYPNNYAHNLTCNYTIRPADPQMTIVLTFDPDLFRIEGRRNRAVNNAPPAPGNYSANTTSFDVFSKYRGYHGFHAGFLCFYDKVVVRGPRRSLGTFCGYTAPQPVVAHGEMTLLFTTDESISDKGWKASYTMESCGGVYNASSGQISTPAHPYNYHHNANCTWLLNAQANQVVDFKFNSLDIEPHSACRYDYVALYDGDSLDAPLIGRFCGDVVPETQIRSTGSSMLVHFYSDSSAAGGGFLAAYRATYGESVGCGGIVNASSGSISSVDIDGDGQYEGDLDCVWQIIVPENLIVQLNFSSFSLESSRVCERYDYVQVHDGIFAHDPVIGTHCGRQDIPSITSSSNALYIHFHSDSDMESSGFTADFTAVPRLCGGSYQLTDGIQNITSPGYPGNYPNNLRCRWTIDAPSDGKNIEVKVLALEIESHHNCLYDYLEIRDSPMRAGASSLHLCGMSPPAHPFISAGRTVHINMVTDTSGQGEGFMLQYSEASCNRTYEGDNGRVVSPGWPERYPRNSHCIIDVITPPGNQLAMFFNFLHIEAHSACQYDYLQISDVNNSSSPLATVCGSVLPNPVFSASNHLQLLFITDASITYPGYDITFISSPTGCGGNLTSDHGSFGSPGFPTSPNTTSTADITCHWLIRVPPRQRPVLNFVAFHVGGSTEGEDGENSGCQQSYVRVYDGASTRNRRFGTYCGTEQPAELTATNRELLVIYHAAEGSNLGRGFLADFQILQ